MPENSELDASAPIESTAVTEPPLAASTSAGVAPPPPPPPARRIPWWTWREPNVVFSRSTLLIVAAAGVAGAIFFRMGNLGIGMTVTGLAALTAVLVSAPADFRRRTSPYWRVITVGVVGLLLVPLFRAADWVGLFCLFAAIVAAATLFVEARGIRGLWLAAMSPFFAPFVGFASTFRRPPRVKPAGTRPSLVLIVVVGVTTVALLLVFGALFASADAAFGSLFSVDVSTDVGPTVLSAVFAGLFVAILTLGGVLLVSQGTRYPSRPRPTLPVWVWAVPVGALLAMFVLFLGVQATALFGGDDFVRRTADLTYSEYAVQGFWQLLAVGVLVIGVTVTAWHFVDPDDARSRLSARILLGGLCAATLAVGASAVHRMTRYINAYGMTEERIFGIFVELLVATVIVGFLVVGFRMNAAGLTRTLVVAGLFATLGFAVLNPERMIADYNIDRYETSGKIDAYYLGGLSADAASEFHRLPTELRDCANWRYGRSHDAPSWRQFTFARYQPGPSPLPDDAYFTPECRVRQFR